jgi:putative ABC transport system permease protein
MFRNHLKIAWRNLWKNKIYSFINVIGLAMGLACSILIGLWIQNERSYDRFHAHAGQLYRVMATLHWGTLSTIPDVPAPLNEALKKEIPEIKFVSTLTEEEILIADKKTRFKEKGYFATSDFLRMFSFPLSKGDNATALGATNGIVISQKLATKYFGQADPMGKILTVNNADPFVVTGVFQDVPANSSLQFDWLISFKVYESKNAWLDTWGNYSCFMYVMLEPKADPGQVNHKLVNFIQKERKDFSSKDEIFLQSFEEAYLHGNFQAGKPDGGRIQYVHLFTMIAAFVLLLACINFMNLSTARSTKRAREVGIKKVVGAQRKIIILQFLGEAFLLTLFSVGVALLIVDLTLPAFNRIIGKTLEIKYTTPSFLWEIGGITLITGLIAGSYPAFFLSSFKPLQVLKSLNIKGAGTNRLRKGLVICQFALSILLIMGTLVVSQQIEFIKNTNIGLDKEHLIAIAAEGALVEHANAFEYELTQSPGIAGVTTCADNPIDITGTSADLDWPGKDPKQVVSISATGVGYDFLKTVGVPLVLGRDFSRTMADSNNYIINESAVRLLNLDNPIGKSVRFWQGKGNIIGVVKDFHLRSLHESITPLILCLQPNNAVVFLVKTLKNKTQQAIASLQSAAEKYNPAYPFEYHFLDEYYEKQYKSEMVVGELVRLFATIAILISCLGLFGLATFTAEQRTKEIGIRKVLGSSASNIAGLLSKEFLALVLLAFAVASPIGWWAANNWLHTFAYRIAVPWQAFVLAGILVMVIAMATISFQSIKAALANPIDALRTE